MQGVPRCTVAAPNLAVLLEDRVSLLEIGHVMLHDHLHHRILLLPTGPTLGPLGAVLYVYCTR
jgi:hypothetical protein